MRRTSKRLSTLVKQSSKNIVHHEDEIIYDPVLRAKGIQQIIRILRKPQMMRNDYENMILKNALREIPFFRQQFDQHFEDMLEDVCENARLQMFVQNEVVIEQDTVGDTFFIVVMGSVRVVKRVRTHLVERNVEEVKQITVLGQGDYFGELSLIEHKPRGATIICNTDCFFLTLDQASFKRILGTKAKRQFMYVIDTLRKNYILKEMTQQTVKALFLIMERKEYRYSDTVYRQKDASDGIYFVVEGEFKLVDDPDDQRMYRAGGVHRGGGSEARRGVLLAEGRAVQAGEDGLQADRAAVSGGMQHNPADRGGEVGAVLVVEGEDAAGEAEDGGGGVEAGEHQGDDQPGPGDELPVAEPGEPEREQRHRDEVLEVLQDPERGETTIPGEQREGDREVPAEERRVPGEGGGVPGRDAAEEEGGEQRAAAAVPVAELGGDREAGCAGAAEEDRAAEQQAGQQAALGAVGGEDAAAHPVGHEAVRRGAAGEGEEEQDAEHFAERVLQERQERGPAHAHADPPQGAQEGGRRGGAAEGGQPAAEVLLEPAALEVVLEGDVKSDHFFFVNVYFFWRLWCLHWWRYTDCTWWYRFLQSAQSHANHFWLLLTASPALPVLTSTSIVSSSSSFTSISLAYSYSPSILLQLLGFCMNRNIQKRLSRKSLSTPRKSSVLGLDVLILNEYLLQEDLHKKELLKKRQDQESQVLYDASSMILKKQYKKCFLHLEKYANQKIQLTLLTQLQVFYDFAYVASKLAQRIALKQKNNIPNISFVLEAYTASMLLWHDFLEDFIHQHQDPDFLSELTGLYLMKKSFQINKAFYRSTLSIKECKSKRKEIIKELEKFQNYFNIFKKWRHPKTEKESDTADKVQTITPEQVQELLKKNINKFLAQLLRYQRSVFMLQKRIYQIIYSYQVDKIQWLMLTFYKKFFVKDSSLGSTREVQILKELSSNQLYEAKFLWEMSKPGAKTKYFQSIDLAAKGIQILVFQMEGQILNDINTGKILQFYSCLKNMLVAFQMLCLIGQESHDVQLIINCEQFSKWIETNVTQYCCNEYSMLRMTNQLISLQDSVYRSNKQVRTKYQWYIRESAEIRRILDKVYRERQEKASEEKQTLVHQLNQKMYEKFNHAELNQHQYLFYRPRPQSAVVKYSHKEQPSTHTTTTQDSQCVVEKHSEKPAQLYIQEVFKQFSKKREGGKELTQQDKDNLLRKFRFLNHKRYKQLQQEHSKKEEKHMLHRKYIQTLDPDIRFKIAPKMEEIFESMINESLRASSQDDVRQYDDIYDDFMEKMKYQQLEQSRIHSDKGMLAYLKRFGNVFSEKEEPFNKQAQQQEMKDMETHFGNQNLHFKIIQDRIEKTQMIQRAQTNFVDNSNKLRETIFRHRKKLDILSVYNIFKKKKGDDNSRVYKKVQSQRDLRWEMYLKTIDINKKHINLTQDEMDTIDDQKNKLRKRISKMAGSFELNEDSQLNLDLIENNKELARTTKQMSTKQNLQRKRISFDELARYAYGVLQREQKNAEG